MNPSDCKTGQTVIGPSGTHYVVTAVMRVNTTPTHVLATCRGVPDGSVYTTVMLDEKALKGFRANGEAKV